MSRNRKIDYDDYDDYDDDYDDYDDYVAKPKAPPKKSAPKAAPASKTVPGQKQQPTPTTKAGAKPANEPKKTTAVASNAVKTGPSVFTKSETAAAQETVTPKVTPSAVPVVDDFATLISDNESAEPSGQDSEYVNTATKQAITMIVVGHVDAGKSTLVGHLLYLLGHVKRHTLNKYEKESEAIGKGSFSLAWVMDERQSEREHGVTIDIAERHITTPNRSFTILDAPGHKDFVPNMIKGTTQADVALLVVPATEGEYETAMKDNAQTKEHAILLKALGVNQVIIVVNKMDHTIPTPWNAERFYRIKEEVSQYLIQQCHFQESHIRCIPVSGLSGENLVSLSAESPGKAWYQDLTLQDGLDTFQLPPRLVDRAFRAMVTAPIIKSYAHGEYDLEVMVLQGKVATHRSLGLVTYSAGHCHVEPVVVSHMKRFTENDTVEELSMAQAREKVILHIVPKHGKVLELTDGHQMVLYKGSPVLTPVNSFRANILTLSSLALPIIPGSKFEIYFKGLELQCVISKLHELVGNPGKRPKCIPGGKTAIVTITLDVKTVVEPFQQCRAFGRFAIRSKGTTVAIGTCECEPATTVA